MEKYELKEPENKGHGWYVATKNYSGMYLRPSGEMKNLTGYSDGKDVGFWDTYEEALKAKEDYEKKQSESELVFPAYYMYIGDGIGHGDILHCETKHDCKLMYVDGYKNVEQLSLNMNVSDWSQMTSVSEEEIYKIVENNEKVNTLNWFGNINTQNNNINETFIGVFNDFEKMNDHAIQPETKRGDGTKADYYRLPEGATELKHLIKYKHMEHGIGEAFCALYRLNDNGEYIRNLKKVKSYIDDAIEYAEMELE